MQISATMALTPLAEPLAPTDPKSVQPPVTDPAPATPAAEPVPAAPTAPPSKFLQKLASGHFNPVADLRHRMRLAAEIKDCGLELPELGAPHGNGKAYQKFLAAYRAMTAPAPAAPSTPSINPMTDPVTPPEPTVTAEPAPTPIVPVDVAA